MSNSGLGVLPLCPAVGDRTSSIDGNAIVPARFFRAFANDDVLRMVLATPVVIVLVIVSLRLRLGRKRLGDGGG